MKPLLMSVAILGVIGTGATPASAQSTAPWTGSIRCELQATAPGYVHQEIQTWTLTGAAPTVQGSVTVYPATWTVTGQGQQDRTRLSSRRVAQWTASVAAVSAPIGFTLHALGRDFDVAKWHAQLTTGGGYTGTDQFFNDGVPQSSQRLVATVYEWQFPKIDAAVTQTQLTGSQTANIKSFIGPLQPGEATATATCTWALGRGTAPPMPPPTMQPATMQPPATQPPATQAPPVSGGTSSSSGTGVAQTSGQVVVPIGQAGNVDLQFGLVPVGTTKTLPLILTNTGSGPYGPVNMAGGAPQLPAFGGSQNCAAVVLPPGQSCFISYTFTPAQPGSVTDVADFMVGTAPNSVWVRVKLGGTGQ